MSHSPSRLGLWPPASFDLTLDGTGAVCRTRDTFFTWRSRVGDLQGNFLLNIFAGCEPVRTLHMWEDREEHQEQARSLQDRWAPWSTPLDTPLDSEPRNAGNKKTEECVPVLNNTLTTMSITPEMSQVTLPCRQEGKVSPGNWAWWWFRGIKPKGGKDRVEHLWAGCDESDSNEKVPVRKGR